MTRTHAFLALLAIVAADLAGAQVKPAAPAKKAKPTPAPVVAPPPPPPGPPPEKPAPAKSDLVDRSLAATATFHHHQALAHRQAGRASEAAAEFQQAADAYADHVRRVPKSPQAIEWRLAMAECLYHAQRYTEAAQAFEAVRDAQGETGYQGDAAIGAAVAYKAEALRQEAEGRFPKRPVVAAQDRPAGKAASAEPLPEAWQKFADAVERLLTLAPGRDKAAELAFATAQLFFARDQLEEARRRSQRVIAAYPESDFAALAALLVVDAHAIEGCARCVAQDVEQFTRGSRPVIDPGSERGRLLLDGASGAAFRQAQAIEARGQLEAAARAFVEIADRDPKFRNADQALFLAAAALERGGQADQAARLVERLARDYPKSEWIGKVPAQPKATPPPNAPPPPPPPAEGLKSFE